jgi:hypothetical protein
VAAAVAAMDETLPAAMMVVVVVAVIGMAMSHELTPNCYRHSRDISGRFFIARGSRIFLLNLLMPFEMFPAESPLRDRP